MKVLFFDTESTDLAASWGRILCCSFAELKGNVFTMRADEKRFQGRNVIDDSALVVGIRDELEGADIIVGWNSILHDIPLLNARLAIAGERGAKLGEKHGTWNLDLMYYSGGQSMKVGGRRLETVSRFFKTTENKTVMSGEVWQLAAAGDKEALNEVVVHCEQDILVLRELFPHLAPYVKKFQFSLSEVWELLDSIPSRVR